MIYVDAEAAPGGDGSKERPFRAISETPQVADEPFVVVLLPGEYFYGDVLVQPEWVVLGAWRKP